MKLKLKLLNVRTLINPFKIFPEIIMFCHTPLSLYLISLSEQKLGRDNNICFFTSHISERKNVFPLLDGEHPVDACKYQNQPVEVGDGHLGAELAPVVGEHECPKNGHFGACITKNFQDEYNTILDI